VRRSDHGATRAVPVVEMERYAEIGPVTAKLCVLAI
jgi:hypothetical protein